MRVYRLFCCEDLSVFSDSIPSLNVYAENDSEPVIKICAASNS